MLRAGLAVALAVLVSGCKGGLYTSEGNDFPCDFTQPEGVRDTVCAPGDVCGVDNRCRGYRYEGPQFELGATEPKFTRVTVLHPLTLLQSPVLALTRRPDKNPLVAHGLALLDTPGADTLALISTSRELTITGLQLPGNFPPPLLSSLANPGAFAVASLSGANADVAFVVNTDLDAGTIFTTQVAAAGGAPVTGADRLRSGSDVALLLRLDDGPMFARPSAGEVLSDAGYVDLLYVESLDDGGTRPIVPVEGRYLAPQASGGSGPKADELVLLTPTGFFLRRSNGVVVRLSSANTELPNLVPGRKDLPQRAQLRHDVAGSVWAFTRDQGGRATALSSWRLDRGPSPSITRLWSDCSPCRNGRIVAFAPTLDPLPAVEVACASAVDQGNGTKGVGLTLIRVVGSAAVEETDECAVEPFESPFDLSQVMQLKLGRRAKELDAGITAVFDDATGDGVLLGGRRGQIWSGPSFSRAVPLFLERAPLLTGTVQVLDGGTVPIALTDRYAALFKPGSGFQTIDVLRATSVKLAQDVVLSSFVGQAPGWGVLSNADTFFLRAPTENTELAMLFGPRLVDARGAPAEGPFFGEAMSDPLDGKLLSFLLGADDGLYFTPVPGELTTTPNGVAPLSPVVTPQASSPIRSLALERSVVGTNGIDKVRAYVVAGRSLFLVTLAGTPPRWTSTPLVLQGGEPIEVWMDNPLGGLGRVGYRDGEVFTLPGGFLLVGELPRLDGGEPPQVLDYENLGGWPVAMTNNGLYEAHYRVVATPREVRLPDGGTGPGFDSVLENRFPDGGINRAMAWNKLTLPDGGEPWLGKKARLQVTQDVQPYSLEFQVPGPPTAKVRVFHLLVYTDDQVLEVGTLTRR